MTTDAKAKYYPPLPNHNNPSDHQSEADKNLKIKMAEGLLPFVRGLDLTHNSFKVRLLSA